MNPHPTTYPGYISLVDQGMPYIKPGSKLAIAEDVFQVCYDWRCGNSWFGCCRFGQALTLSLILSTTDDDHSLVLENMTAPGEWGDRGGWLCQMLLSRLGDRPTCREGLCSQGRNHFLNNSHFPTNDRFKCLQMTGNGTVWTRCTPGKRNLYGHGHTHLICSGSRACLILWKKRRSSGRLVLWLPLDASPTGTQWVALFNYTQEARMRILHFQ